MKLRSILNSNEHCLRHRWHSGVSLITSLGLLLISCAAFAGTYVRPNTNTYPIVDRSYYLVAGNTYEWETANLQVAPGCSGSDTILRLLNSWGGHIDMNDDWNGTYASRINYTATYTGNHRILVHAYATHSCGTMDLKFNGQVDLSSKEFGGVREIFNTSPIHGKIQTAFQKGGGYGYQMIVADNYGGTTLHWSGYTWGPGIFSGLTYTEPSPSAGPRYVYYASLYSLGSEDITVMQNYGGDSDFDGLTDFLENELGTCATSSSTVSGWNCGTQHPSDTDNDGLSDYIEVFGDFSEIFTSYNGWTVDEAVALPLWGASPLHKDVFVEMDYQPGCRHNTTYCLAQPTNQDTVFSFATASWTSWDSDLSAAYNNIPESKLGNPDGEDGISVWVDVAGTTYAENSPRFDGGGSDFLPWAVGSAGNHCKMNYVNYRSSNQRPLSQAYMHYYCAHRSTGGQGQRPGMVFQGELISAAHELGHNLGLDHGGGDGYNGKPHYQSLMNYAYPLTMGFSDGSRTYGLNPSQLYEGYLTNNTWLSANPWWYLLSGNKVDWNRNGIFELGNFVSSPITWDGGNKGNEAFTIFKDVRPNVAKNPNNTPALARHSYSGGERLYMFYATGTESQSQVLRYSYMTVEGDGTCTNHAAKVISPGSAPCGVWQDLPGPWFARGAAAVSFTQLNLAPALFIAVRRPSGEVWVFRVFPDAAGALPGTWTVVKKFAQGSNFLAKGDPDIATDGGRLRLVWRNLANQVIEAQMGNDGIWSSAVNTAFTSITTDPTIYFLQSANAALLVTTEGTARIRIRRAPTFASSSWSWDSDFDTQSQIYKAVGKVGVAMSDVFQIMYTSANTGLLIISRFEALGVRDGLAAHQWAMPASGVDLIDFPGDANVHASIASEITPTIVAPVYFPYADGMFNVSLKDHDDEAALGLGLCASFRDGRACNGAAPINGLVVPISPEEVLCPPFE